MQTSNEDKIETIRYAAKKALDLLAEVREILAEAEYETGYCFGSGIMQQFEENRIGGAAAELDCIAYGNKNEEILEEIGEEE